MEIVARHPWTDNSAYVAYCKLLTFRGIEYGGAGGALAPRVYARLHAHH